MMLNYKGVRISWLGHDGFLFEHERRRIAIDPFKITHSPPCDAVLLTHDHFDHCSPPDVKKLLGPEGFILAPKECEPHVARLAPVTLLKPGEHFKNGWFAVKAVPAYNVNKYRDLATKTVFHPKSDGKLGFLITFGGVTFYHAGDTDRIPEMTKITCDVALLPVSGTYVMTAEEAAAAARAIKPKIVIPMHYGSIVGNETDAVNLRHLLGAKITVEVLEKE